MKELENVLIDKNVTPTAMRLVVLDFLFKQSKAISLTDMELELKLTDRVTLYRTLKTFEECGLVHRIENGSGATCFALCQDCNPNQHHDMHVHFYCNSCKQTLCLPKIKIPPITLPINFQSEEMSLIIKGVCSTCRK